jgi:hypothetical protein
VTDASSPSRRQPSVLVVTLGGTIAMTPGASGGVTPALDADDLLASVPGLADVRATVTTLDFTRIPGASLTVDHIARLAGELNRRAAEGLDGIVVSQGTDTIEETAYLLDLLYDQPAPLIVTGAMRPPQQAGADGPANLLAAVQTAAGPGARGMGVFVVFNDEIHSARHVRKTHTSSTATFVSPDTGPLGRVVEGRPRFLVRPVAPGPKVAVPFKREARVGLVVRRVSSIRSRPGCCSPPCCGTGPSGTVSSRRSAQRSGMARPGEVPWSAGGEPGSGFGRAVPGVEVFGAAGGRRWPRSRRAPPRRARSPHDRASPAGPTRAVRPVPTGPRTR